MFSTAFSFGVVVVVWISFGGFGLLPESVSVVAEESTNNPSPFANIKDLIGESTAGILGSFDTFRGEVSYERAE